MKTLIVPLAVILMVSQLAIAGSRKDSWDNLNQLKSGQKIEVVDMKYNSLKGEFIAFSDDQISIRTSNSAVSILRTEVRSVKNREKNRRVRGGVVGALLGAAAGTGAGALISSVVADSSETTYGAAIGFWVGMGAGAGLGAAKPSPVPIYEIREPSQR